MRYQHIPKSLFEKFKVEDTPKGEEAVKVTKKVYLASPDKKEANNKINEIIKKSKDIDETIKNGHEILGHLWDNVPLDTTGSKSYLYSLEKNHQQK